MGFLLGMDHELLPADETDTWRLLWLQADYEFQPDQDSTRLAKALQESVGPLLIGDSVHPAAHVNRSVVTELLCAYSRLIIGSSNAGTLDLPDNKLAQAVVAGLAAINYVVRFPLRLVPGGNRVRGVVGRRNIERLAALTMKRCRGDRSYNRHDNLAAESRGIVAAAGAHA